MDPNIETRRECIKELGRGRKRSSTTPSTGANKTTLVRDIPFRDLDLVPNVESKLVSLVSQE
jgi:hypothetical protein